MMSIGTRKSFCTGGLLKLSKDSLKLTPEVQAAIPNALIINGESVLISLVNPKHLGICVFKLIVANCAE